MRKKNLFGAYLKEKRVEKDISLRELASKTELDTAYLSKIENGKKPPPSDSALFKIADSLMLDFDLKTMFFDIAMAEKQNRNDKNIYLPADLKRYISNVDKVKIFLREVDELGYGNEFWDEMLKNLSSKYIP